MSSRTSLSIISRLWPCQFYRKWPRGWIFISSSECRRPATRLGAARKAHGQRVASTCSLSGSSENSEDAKKMEEVAEERETANGDSSDSSGEDEAHFSKYDFAETWNDTDDTVLPNKLKDIGMAVATRKGEEKIL